MDRYQKVEKPKPESPINENEIRITTLGAIRNYITYATTLLQVYVWAVSRQLSLPPLFFSALLVICWSYAITMVKSGLMLSEWLRVIEKRGKEIVLKAMGQAINKTVAIAEIIKKRIPRLHQDTAISSVSITDIWEPIEEGLVPVEMTRHVSMISITLSARELNKNSPGYQAPSNVEPPKPQYRYQYQQQQQPPRQGHIPYNAVNEDSYGRGQGRGRGRGRGLPGVDMDTIKKMMGIQTGAEVVGEAEVGVIVEPDMKEAEVEGAEFMAVAVEGWVGDQGVVAIKQ
ncbi:hypothetical protein Patl1_01618 [Pistacia atlantica]|uniref:Uncharacterized protein n=1 Tax=Pistacia atlantica TaxID=434234 RepID=A0ACC1C943_9ROSI|nr:hypothetical protein Patl1_01618 [Pistacia atlantica]